MPFTFSPRISGAASKPILHQTNGGKPSWDSSKASEPLPVMLSRNQVLNRVFLDVFGWGGPAILTARNRYERIEKLLDVGSWLMVGVGTPILLGQLFNRWVVPHYLLKPFKLSNQATPLHLPWAWVDETGKKPLSQLTPHDVEILTSALKCPKKQALAALTPQMMARLRGLKLSVLTMDMLLMATKGQGYYWGKNWLTEKISGKKGFSGEFNYATEKTLSQNNKTYQAQQKRLLTASLLIGYGSALALPLMIGALLKTPVTSGKGVLGTLKNIVHTGFNHTEGIFMSKWILSWHTLFNWNIPALLSSRDKHERREALVKTSTALFLYTLGDDFMTGMFAHGFNRWSIKRSGVPILASEPGVFGLPRLRPLKELMTQYGKHSVPYRLGVLNFWVSIFGACAAINTVLPLLNNYYTRRKVIHEQQLQGLKADTLGLKPIMKTLSTHEVTA